MKLHQLNAIAAIADTGSIRAAARYLGLSPAAVNKSVRDLEASLNALLMTRSASGAGFTESGRVLLTHARLVLSQLDRAESEINAMRGATKGKLTIGVTPWLAMTFLPETVVRFQEKMPHVQLEMFEGLLGVTQPRLRDGSLDFSIGQTPPQLSQSEFQNVPLFLVHGAVVARRGHPKAECRTLGELQDDTWVLNWDPASRMSITDDWFARHGLRVPRVIHLAHSLTIALSMVEKSDSLSIFPWPMVETLASKGTIIALPVQEQASEGVISLTTRSGEPMSSAAGCFVECLRQSVTENVASRDPTTRNLFHSMEVLF